MRHPAERYIIPDLPSGKRMRVKRRPKPGDVIFVLHSSAVFITVGEHLVIGREGAEYIVASGVKIYVNTDTFRSYTKFYNQKVMIE